MRVGILGGGAWGQALARLVLAAGHEPFVAYQGKRPPHILPSTDDPPRVPAACELVLVATSASEVRGSIAMARPGPANRVVVAGRGLDPATGAWLTEIVEGTGAFRVGALAGPAPVDEILSGGLCAGVVASAFDEVRAMTITALHSSRYRVYETRDVAGVQLAGAMIPVLAALVGFATQLGGAGVGVHAMVLARGLAEATRLGRALGADPATFLGLAGVGDLVAAQCRPGHPHFDAGVALAKGASTSARADSGPVALARGLLAMARPRGVELPLTAALVAIAEGAEPMEVLGALMQRSSKSEGW
jgi:glycerol-3-phosphate dehydrogenase (NAD(P)+)